MTRMTPSPINCLLAALPDAVATEWQPHLEAMDLPEGHVLCEPGQGLTHVYFPTSAIVSWLHILASGNTTEISMVGREGMVGLFMLMGAPFTNNQAVVQTGGRILRMRLDVVLQSFRTDRAVQRPMMLFAQSMIGQMSQGNVCRQHHSLEQQLCRLLLMILDRQTGLEVHKTHEALALLLGVRREGVTLAASKLMKAGVLNYARGRIQVLNLEALRQHSCECYEHLQRQTQPLLSCQAPAGSAPSGWTPGGPSLCCAV